MHDEIWIRRQVRRILSEEKDPENEGSEEKTGLPTTTGPGRGRFKKELKDMKALADENPQQLMKNLGISGVGGGNAQEALESLLGKAIDNDEMSTVYSKAIPKEDAYGRGGVSISLSGEMGSRDALIFIRETVKGAKKAGVFGFNAEIQVEILDGSILAYLSPNTFQWNKRKN